MEHAQLRDLYTGLSGLPLTVYTAPKINRDFPDSDYLFNLCRPVIEIPDGITVKSVTVFSHYKPFFALIAGKKVVFHYHWLEFQDLKSLVGMPWKLLWIILFRLAGGTLIWTIHNEQPHDGKWLKLHLFLHKNMAKYAAALHVHCRYASELMSRKLGVRPDKFHIIPHPAFPAQTMDKSRAVPALNKKYKVSLAPERPVALIFGQISHYKGLPELLTDLAALPGVQVLIAGTIKKGNKRLRGRLIRAAEDNPAVTLITRFMPDEDLPLLFNTADICAFNYTRILTSGGVHMALSYHKTVVAPAQGCLQELSDNSLVHLFNTGKERFELLKKLIHHA